MIWTIHWNYGYPKASKYTNIVNHTLQIANEKEQQLQKLVKTIEIYLYNMHITYMTKGHI